ncbi:MAG: ECF transporter S component [Lachnospiraceae bacterium]
MKNKKTWTELILGGILSAGGLISCIVGVIGYEPAEKINKDDPYFPFLLWGIFALLIGLVVLVNGIYHNAKKDAVITYSSSEQVKRLSQAALFAALAYIMFTYFRIDINLPGGSTAFHLGNTFVVLAALLLGGSLGGTAGALGLTLADLTTIYVTSAPKTFFLKLCIGLITGFVAHRLFHITKITDKKKLVVATIVSSAAGLLFNVVADPLAGYFYKMYLFGIPQDASAALAKIATLTTAVNAGLSILCAVVLYLALRPVLIKAGLYLKLEK